jgi:cytochrome c oxidase assembly protein subunit 15
MLVGLQVLLGGTNIVLAAPGWLQIVHLLGAQLVWVSVCAAYLSLNRR